MQAAAQHASACLISDLHLDETRPAVLQGLAGFLDHLPAADALYILGDLFEAWIGDDDDRPLIQEVAALLSAISDRGITLYLMRGNRDFLLGEAFCRRVGAMLLPDPSVHILGGTPTLLMHGDSLCTGDADYQSFRRMTRDPDWQARVLATPLAARRQLARELRAMSTGANSMKAEDIMDVDPVAVRECLREFAVERLVHGHTHRPARHELAGGTRWVLGDWGEDSAWCLDIGAGEPALRSFRHAGATR